MIKTWAKLQGMVALSSTETESSAMMKGAKEALALRRMLAEMDTETRAFAHTDSSAAKAGIEKSGLIHTQHL